MYYDLELVECQTCHILNHFNGYKNLINVFIILPRIKIFSPYGAS